MGTQWVAWKAGTRKASLKCGWNTKEWEKRGTPLMSLLTSWLKHEGSTAPLCLLHSRNIAFVGMLFPLNAMLPRWVSSQAAGNASGSCWGVGVGAAFKQETWQISMNQQPPWGLCTHSAPNEAYCCAGTGVHICCPYCWKNLRNQNTKVSHHFHLFRSNLWKCKY